MADPTDAPSRQMPMPPQYLGNDPTYGPQYRQQGGIGDAIANSIWMLARMLAPKSLTQFDPNVQRQVEGATNNTAPLGQQFPK